MIVLAFIFAAAGQAMSDTRPANGRFVRGEWRGDCVRGGDSALAETCRAVRRGPVTITILRTAVRMEIIARPSGCARTIQPVILAAEAIEGMRRAAVVSEAVDAAARAAIRQCRGKARAPALSGGALFDMLAATDGLILGDE